jgi:hypothetical protein
VSATSRSKAMTTCVIFIPATIVPRALYHTKGGE